MAKFYGEVGYVESEESDPVNHPGVHIQVPTEQAYSGDVIRNTNRWQTGENLNDDFVLNNMISIIADPFAYENFQYIRYVKWMGATWKVTSVDVQRPRLILTIGGVYNGVTVESA